MPGRRRRRRRKGRLFIQEGEQKVGGSIAAF